MKPIFALVLGLVFAPVAWGHSGRADFDLDEYEIKSALTVRQDDREFVLALREVVSARESVPETFRDLVPFAGDIGRILKRTRYPDLKAVLKKRGPQYLDSFNRYVSSPRWQKDLKDLLKTMETPSEHSVSWLHDEAYDGPIKRRSLAGIPLWVESRLMEKLAIVYLKGIKEQGVSAGYFNGLSVEKRATAKVNFGKRHFERESEAVTAIANALTPLAGQIFPIQKTRDVWGMALLIRSRVARLATAEIAQALGNVAPVYARGFRRYIESWKYSGDFPLDTTVRVVNDVALANGGLLEPFAQSAEIINNLAAGYVDDMRHDMYQEDCEEALK